MDRRSEISKLFKTICPNVYFQPGDSVTMKYPAIIYNRIRPEVMKANNHLYLKGQAYHVLYATKSTETMVDTFMELFPYCSCDQMYRSDGYNYEVYTIY